MPGIFVDDDVGVGADLEPTTLHAWREKIGAERERGRLINEARQDHLLRARQIRFCRFRRILLDSVRAREQILVETQAPHVFGDDEQAHAIGRASADRHADDHRQLRVVAQISSGFVDDQLVPFRTLALQHLALDDVLPRRRVEHIHEPRNRITWLEDLERHHVDGLDYLSARVGVDGDFAIA